MRKSTWWVGAAVMLVLAAGWSAAQQPPMIVRATPNVGGNLTSRLHAGSTIEAFVAEVVAALRRADRDGDGLDRADVAFFEKMRLAQARGGEIGQVLSKDLNGDFHVDRAELEEIARGSESRLPRQVDQLLDKYDLDGDDRITLTEVASLAAPWSRNEPLKEWLDLDPNRDGHLWPEELRRLAEAAFNRVDRDKDGEISSDEAKAITPVPQSADSAILSARCGIPDLAAGTRLVAIGAYEGNAVSSVAIGGLDQETNAAQIVVEPGSRPITLMLSSYESMIWQVRGATDRVNRVIVSSHQSARVIAQGQGRVTSAAGITGIAADRVTVTPPGCPPYFDSKNAAAAGQIKALTGRAPEAVYATYSIGQVSTSHDRVVPTSAASARMPKGFDSGMWAEAIRFWPGGLVTVDPRQVVAKASVAPYAVLPSQMGLSQLVGAKAVVRDGDRFTVVRRIAHLPPRMTGSHSVTLVFPKGIAVPAGDPGHSCLIVDGTKSSGASCR